MEDDLFGGLLFAEEPAPSPAPKAAKKAAKAKLGKTAEPVESTAPNAERKIPPESSIPAALHNDAPTNASQNERGRDPALAHQSAHLAVHGEVKRGHRHMEPKAPLACGGEAPTPGSEFFTKKPTASDGARVDADPAATSALASAAASAPALSAANAGRRTSSGASQNKTARTTPPHVPLAWPEALQGTPSIAVLENAIAKNRLAHGLLLHGDDFTLLTQVALALADRLLNTPEASAYFPVAQHPDCFALRPSGASRQVSADDTRELIGKTQVSGSVSPRKVAILYECDRMNLAAANIFLKTLEEPPANTTLLLLTTQPYALLPTVRSRVLHFRFPVGSDSLAQAAGLPAWLSDYQAWLGQLCEGVTGKREIADSIFTLYGLVARFDAILTTATAEAWESEKNALSEELDKEEQKAVEKRLANGIRQRIFAEIEQATRAFALPRLTRADSREGENAAETTARIRRAHTAAISELEHSVGLLRLNLNHAAALENFLLHSMRLWARR